MLQLLRGTAALAALTLFHPPAAATTARAAAPPCIENWTEQRATGVSDARSIQLEDGRVLRLAGIEPIGVVLAESRDADAALVERLAAIVNSGALRVALLGSDPDRYGRFPALAATERDELIQEAAAREGLAIAFPTTNPLPCFDRILQAEGSARRERRGFWKQARVLPARPDALRSRVGGLAIFEGVAVSVGSRPYRTYLNFGGRWSEDVTVEIAAENRDSFGGEPELAKLAGRRLRVRGYLEERGGPMVVVRSPLQIEVLGMNADGEVP